MSEIVGEKVGPYRVIGRVGHGGMSSVFKALGPASEEAVALKILSPLMALDPGFKARFEREVSLLRALEHPHIVPILDYGESDGYAYIVMPFYIGGTLQDLMRDGSISLEEGVRLLHQISDALQFAHEHGVVHRDVKPSNILIDEEGNARLTDFGFARLYDTALSLTGSALIGTPSYMSPEQGRGEKVDGRSDQYSLGVLLYQLATGKLPFEAENPMAIVLKHINEPVLSPRQINPELNEALEEVIVRALQKEPRSRFDSMRAFDRAVEQGMSGISFAAEEARRPWAKRMAMARRAALAAVLVLLVGLSLGECQSGILARTLGLSVPWSSSPSSWVGTPLVKLFGTKTATPTLSVAETPSPVQTGTALAGTLTAAAYWTQEPSGTTTQTATVTPSLTKAPPGTLTAQPTQWTPAPTAVPTATLTATVATATSTQVPSSTPTTTPTSTSTATTPPSPTATPSPEPTPTPVPMHLGGLAGSSYALGNGWAANVTVIIHGPGHTPLLQVRVAGEWSTGKYSTCNTDLYGTCQLKSGRLEYGMGSVVLQVIEVTRAGYVYRPGQNDVSDTITVPEYVPEP